MSEGSEAARNHAFHPKMVAAVIAIALMAFGALVTLLAWGPEIQSKDRAGTHAYSSSALGYGGLVELLKLSGRSVSISRTRHAFTAHEELLILAPGETAAWLEDIVPIAGPALIILPKWTGAADINKPSWQRDSQLGRVGRAETILAYFDETASIDHVTPPDAIDLTYGRLSPKFDEKLQLIKSDVLVPVVSVSEGVILAKMPDTDVYFLADPDLANTFGLAVADNARLILSILQTISNGPDQAILFDVSLNGLEQTTSLLRIILDIPFLGATLTILAAMLLLGWAACVRFGAPLREQAAFALGKQALTDNTAGLFAMTKRETQMAPGYLALSRKVMTKALGAPAHLSEAELTALLDRLGPSEKDALTWTQMAAGLREPTATREDLLRKAQQLYRWRQEKMHGHR